MDAQILVNENVSHEELPKRLTDDSYIDRFFSFKQYEQSKLKQVVLGGGLIFLVLLLTIILGKPIVCLRNGVLLVCDDNDRLESRRFEPQCFK